MKNRSSRNVKSKVTFGIDVSDRKNEVCIICSDTKDVIKRVKVGNTPPDIVEFFSQWPASPVALEVGCHSPWLNDVLSELGHDPAVANPRQVALITRSLRKTDKHDAEMLARLLCADRRLLRTIQHRKRSTRLDLTLLRTRNQLVRTRTALVGSIRGTVKSYGGRIRSMDAAVFHNQAAQDIPRDVLPQVEALLEVLRTVAEQIKSADREVTRLCREKYPETMLLRQIPRVGEITSLTFVLTIEDPERFEKSADVGAYAGLTPRRADSGDRSPELSITKAGDRELRRLLVQCAHQIIGKLGPPSDLKDWGLALAARGKKQAKKKAVVAVARKLVVLMHRLWVTGEVYRPRRDVV